MARVILCAGKRGKHAFRVGKSNIRLFSAEEICYYLYHNAATAEDFLTDPALADYFETELLLPEVAGRLRLLLAADAMPKEYATVIFGITPMYTAEEIAEFMLELEKVSEMPGWQKQKVRADAYLERRNYREAAGIYESLLRSRKEKELSEVAIGNLYHNLAVCELHTTGPGTAAVYFAESYEKNRNPESLQSYLLALRLSKRDNDYLNALERYGVSEQLCSELDTKLLGVTIEAGETADYRRMMRVKKLLEEGQLQEYRQATQSLVEEFKQQYRMDNM